MYLTDSCSLEVKHCFSHKQSCVAYQYRQQSNYAVQFSVHVFLFDKSCERVHGRKRKTH